MTKEKFYVTRDGRRVARRVLKSPRQFVRNGPPKMSKTAATNGARVQHKKVPLKPLKNASPHSKSAKLFAQAREALRHENQLLARQKQQEQQQKRKQAIKNSINNSIKEKDNKLLGKAKRVFRDPEDFDEKSDERKEHDWNQLWELFVEEKSKQGVSAGPNFQPHWTGKMLLPKNPFNLRKQFFSQCWNTKYQMECSRGINQYKNLFANNKFVNLDTCLHHLFYGHQTWHEPLFHTVTSTGVDGKAIEKKVEILRPKLSAKERINILDCGGGQGRALAQILKQLKRGNAKFVKEKVGKFVGVGLHVWNKLGSRLKKHHEQMEWYVADILQALKYLQSNFFDVIIDCWGCYHYSGNKAEIVSGYLEKMKPGAVAFILIGGTLETIIEPDDAERAIPADAKSPTVKKPQYFEQYLEKQWPKIFTVGDTKTGGGKWLLIRKPKTYVHCIPNLKFPVKSFVWENIIHVNKNGKSTSQMVKPVNVVLKGPAGLGYNKPMLLNIDTRVLIPWSWNSRRAVIKP